VTTATVDYLPGLSARAPRPGRTSATQHRGWPRPGRRPGRGSRRRAARVSWGGIKPSTGRQQSPATRSTVLDGRRVTRPSWQVDADRRTDIERIAAHSAP